jgi:hypothetical protein
VHSHHVCRAAKTLIAVALFVGVGCSDDFDSAGTTTTTITATPTGSACDFKPGDRITADVAGGGRPCLVTFFDCADGRIHVTAELGDGKRLEGFAPTDQRGTPRPDTRDAVWQEYGGEYQGSGRTKLQFDCGG